MANANAVKSAGSFDLLPGGAISGPADYLKAKGDAKLASILSGNDAGFNAMMRFAPPGADLETLVLVALQTDYAGWLGMNGLLAGLKK